MTALVQLPFQGNILGYSAHGDNTGILMAGKNRQPISIGSIASSTHTDNPRHQLKV
jgi:hypothetical protein